MDAITIRDISITDSNIIVNAVGGEQLLGLVQAALSVTLTTQLLGMDTGGNISTEDVLHMCDESGIDLAKLMELSRTLKDLLHHDTDSYVLRAGRSCDLLVGKD